MTPDATENKTLGQFALENTLRNQARYSWIIVWRAGYGQTWFLGLVAKNTSPVWLATTACGFSTFASEQHLFARNAEYTSYSMQSKEHQLCT